MKAVIIGSSGHFGYALPSVAAGGVDIIGIAVTHGEDIAALERSLLSVGKKAPVYDDPALMLKNSGADIAIINTRFDLNAEYSILALGLGRSVFTEKPGALGREQSERLREAYENAPGAPFLVPMYGIRYEAPFMTAKRLLDSKTLGSVRLISSQKSYKLGSRPEFYRHRETYGGIISWVACHALDWTRWFCGREFTSVRAAASNVENHGQGDMEITSALLCTLEGGIIATVTADMLRPSSMKTHGDDRARIVTEDHILEITGGQLYLDGELTAQDAPGDIFADMLKAMRSPSPQSVRAQYSDELFAICDAVNAAYDNIIN